MSKFPARYYDNLPDKRVRCTLCPSNCAIKPGNFGNCRLRKNDNGELIAAGYGQLVSLAIDPIEKKPLYHFYPGKPILSTGPNGCNLRCPFCQNWTISQQETTTDFVPPEQLVEIAEKRNSIGVAFTYTEPLIWFEYFYDCAKLLKARGLKVVAVSNGYLNEEPARELFKLIDAANIDFKSASKEFYKKTCRGNRDDVIRTIKIAKEAGVFVELTNLLITGENDSDKDLNEIVNLIADIDPLIPFHISRYFPQYKYNNPPTPVSTLKKAVEIARQKLAYVYPGNYIDGSDTVCPDCGRILVERSGYSIGLPDGETQNCPGCGRKVDIIW
ncbi:MAG: AmmeMemoRadiSam system radical SAM enzyme [candidate division Zixibacteria bacterium]|nr:AmmeMemoRadiSam system radical SAM enzyme [candidate division Zixibacteria bacterium]